MFRQTCSLFVGGALLALAAADSAEAGLLIELSDGVTTIASSDDPLSADFDGNENGATAIGSLLFPANFGGWSSIVVGALVIEDGIIDIQIEVEETSGSSTPSELTLTITNDMFSPAYSGNFRSTYSASVIDNTTITVTTTVDGQTYIDGESFSSPSTFPVSLPIVTGDPYTVTHAYTITPTSPGLSSIHRVSSTTTTQAVPEPTTLALMGVGLVGAGLAMRRRNRG